MDYIKLELNINPKKPWTEIIINDLAEIGFESFTEEDSKLQAYIPVNEFNKEEIDIIADRYKRESCEISFKKVVIPHQNWNETWESDFSPVEVDKKLIIDAPFHDINTSEYEHSVVIQPQMSFRTGHHQTTYLLSKAILDLDIKNKSVLDVGTGTGILGILAAKLGAKDIFGTDIETGACENAVENIERNEVTNFTVKEGDIDVVPEQEFDIIFANINKNVLKAHLPSYSVRSHKDGLLLLSGFFESDISELEEAAKKSKFNLHDSLTYETWAVMILKKL